MSYQEDYDEAVRNGEMLDPVPETGWVNVRRIAEEIGGRSAVPWLLGSGKDGPLQLLVQCGVRDQAKVDQHFETWLPTGEAVTLRNYLASAWREIQHQRVSVRELKRDRAKAGITEGRVQELINATSLSALQGQVADGQIPDAIARDSEIPAQRTALQVIALITGQIAFSDLAGMIADGQVPASFMRDAELTLARVATALGLTTAEAAAILTGDPTLSGQDLTFTRNDGTQVTITLPAGMGGGTADRQAPLRFGCPRE